MLQNDPDLILDVGSLENREHLDGTTELVRVHPTLQVFLDPRAEDPYDYRLRIRLYHTRP